MRNTLNRLFGVAALRSSFLIALWSSASIAATVNVTTSNPTPAIGEPYTVTVSGIDFPETAGAVLGLRYDASVVDITGVMLAPGSPFTGGVVVSPYSDPPSFPDPLEWIAVLGPNFGPNPSGSFNAFVIQATAIAPGDATIKLVDNQSTNCWADVSTSDCVKPITYCYFGNGCEEAPTIPIPASVWLFGSAVAALGWIRRASRKAASMNAGSVSRHGDGKTNPWTSFSADSGLVSNSGKCVADDWDRTWNPGLCIVKR